VYSLASTSHRREPSSTSALTWRNLVTVHKASSPVSVWQGVADVADAVPLGMNDLPVALAAGNQLLPFTQPGERPAGLSHDAPVTLGTVAEISGWRSVASRRRPLRLGWELVVAIYRS